MTMPRWTISLAIAAIAVAGTSPAQAEGPLRRMMRERMAERMKADAAPGGTVHAYGADPLQTMKVWQPADKPKPAPLVLFVHGGGWRMGSKDNATGAEKVGHLTASGYAVASIDYRLVPQATVEQQAADVAGAVAWAKANAAKIGVDPTRIAVMGHSAGAHLVALIGTDPSYLKAVGLSEADLRGVIALDGACYDVPRQMAEGGNFMRQTYEQAFGTDAARQKALSPITHVASPNAPAFLILHVERTDGTAQSEALAAALKQAGTPVEVQGFSGKGLRGHMEINRELGKADYPATAVVDRWLKAAFGE